MMLRTTVFLLLAAVSLRAQSPLPPLTTPSQALPKTRGVPGSTGWRCHVIFPDPHDDGPDGINLHDWDRDGNTDLFVNAEEGKYSRLYFHPGSEAHQLWKDFVQFSHGPCEDSGIGDLDHDGDVDYVANGGWVYFNPGQKAVRDAEAWKKMDLFDYERRVPTVCDVDGDGLNDLVVGAQEWYRQPNTGKHEPGNWQKYVIGKNRWPMNCLLSDIDGDGDDDLVVPDRGVEVCWYEHPDGDQVFQPWKRRTLHPHTEPMFMAIADVDGSGTDDFVITGGSRGKHAKQLIVLLRSNRTGLPKFVELLIDQPCGLFPKGVAVGEIDGDASTPEIVVVPKSGNLWLARVTNRDGKPAIETEIVEIPGADTRLKMDNAWLGDLDADGDLDVVTTEENGGWGVIWFENPQR